MSIIVKPALTQERLKELLRYDPETGEFTWINRTRGYPRADMARAGAINHGYIVIGIDGRRYMGHRLVFLYMTGQWPGKDQVDHIDGDPGNNRWSNLREATTPQNAQNARPKSNNKSGYRGVHFQSRHNRYRAIIRIDGKKTYLGVFQTAEAAAAVYEAAAKQHHGSFYRGQA